MSTRSESGPPRPPALHGHLDLVCALDKQGRSHLRRQSFCAPMHISKPYRDADTLIVNAVNPTGSMQAGDRVRVHVIVEPGARLLLTAPSATRVQNTRDDSAEVDQIFRVAPGSLLEVFPQLVIPQRGANYRQSTTVHLAECGELLLFDMFAPGRVASGESFRFQRLRWATDIFADDILVARERSQLMPDDESTHALRAVFPHAYYASGFILSRRLRNDSECWGRIRAQHDRHGWVGCSPLVSNGWVIKIVAADSITLRRKLHEVRHELYHALGRSTPAGQRSHFSEPAAPQADSLRLQPRC